MANRSTKHEQRTEAHDEGLLSADSIAIDDVVEIGLPWSHALLLAISALAAPATYADGFCVMRDRTAGDMSERTLNSNRLYECVCVSDTLR